MKLIFISQERDFATPLCVNKELRLLRTHFHSPDKFLISGLYYIIVFPKKKDYYL